LGADTREIIVRDEIGVLKQEEIAIVQKAINDALDDGGPPGVVVSKILVKRKREE